MIAYLQGKIVLKTEKFVILDVGGVGYKVFLSQRTLSKIPQKEKTLKVFCFLNVRENLLDLYGFLDFKELEFFEMLQSLPGLGPKAALEIASLGSLEELKEKILAGQEEIFEKIPGIGRKKARTIILEISGKIKELEKKEKTQKIKEEEEKDAEVIIALTNLGFSKSKIKEALSRLPQDLKDTEQKIKQALKLLTTRI